MPPIFFTYGITSGSIPADLFLPNGSRPSVNPPQEPSKSSDTATQAHTSTSATTRTPASSWVRKTFNLLRARTPATTLPFPLSCYQSLVPYTTPQLIDLVAMIRDEIQYVKQQREALDPRTAHILAEPNEQWQHRLDSEQVSVSGKPMPMEAAGVVLAERVENWEDCIPQIVHVLYQRVFNPGFDYAVETEGSVDSLEDELRGMHKEPPPPPYTPTYGEASARGVSAAVHSAGQASSPLPPATRSSRPSRIRALLATLTPARRQPSNIASFSTPELVDQIAELWDQIHSFNSQTTFITTSLVGRLAETTASTWERQEREFMVPGFGGQVHWFGAQEVLYQAIEENTVNLENIQAIFMGEGSESGQG